MVIVLAGLLATLVGHAVDRADHARRQWGRTEVVWVAERPIQTGERLEGGFASRRWPRALIPTAAVRGTPPAARAAGPIDAGAVLTTTLIDRDAKDGRTVALPLPDAALPVHEGDVVDVWATADPATIPEGTAGTQRVAARARVLDAVDGSVVLRVSPSQVADLAAAGATATITLVGVR